MSEDILIFIAVNICLLFSISSHLLRCNSTAVHNSRNLFVTFVGTSSALVSDTLKVTNGGDLGTWGEPQYCVTNTYAIGYDMKCPYGHSHIDNYATSEVGPLGSWVGETYCNNSTSIHHFLTLFRLQVEPQLETGDDTSANYVKFKCRDLEGATTSYEVVKDHPGYGLWGTYGSWSSDCPAGTAVCGIKTRVEAPQRALDDTALNDVMFYCCN